MKSETEHKKWMKTRAKWFKKNPSNHEGYYTCHYCYKWVPKRYITLDHMTSRSNAPELRHDLSNIVPACFNCNADKGSLNVEQYQNKLSKKKRKEHHGRIEVDEDNDYTLWL